MKKFLLTVVLVLSATFAQAQARAVTTNNGVVTLRGITSGTLAFTNNSLLRITFTTTIGTTQTAGLTLENTTTPANGSAEYSPSLQICGTADNSSVGHVKEVDCWRIENRPATNSGTTTQALTFSDSTAGGAYTNLGSLDQNGTWNMQQFSAGNSSYFTWFGRTRLYSSADSLFNVMNTGNTFGLQFNAGTAATTVTACGTGAITVPSRNGNGAFTATGAAACTVTFATGTWTNTPRCVITATKVPTTFPYISAISTTSFTVSGMTAGDNLTVNYICEGAI